MPDNATKKKKRDELGIIASFLRAIGFSGEDQGAQILNTRPEGTDLRGNRSGEFILGAGEAKRSVNKIRDARRKRKEFLENL
jgi:hypothetical protein